MMKRCPVCGIDMENVASTATMDGACVFYYWCPKDGVWAKEEGAKGITYKRPEMVPPLMTTHWEENPDFPVADWKAEVEADETRLGYWQWCFAKKEDVS